MLLAVGIAGLGGFVLRSSLPSPAIIVGGVGMSPVATVRIVEEQPEAMPRAGLGELFYEVPASGRVHAVELCLLGVKQTKRIVMPCGEIDITHLAVNGELRDGLGIKALGGEIVLELFVLYDRHELAQLHPLVTPKERVEAIVQEQAIAGLFEPL